MINQIENYSAANSGLIRPPLIFGSAVATGEIISLSYPLAPLVGYGSKVATWFFLFFGVALFLWTRSEFRRAGTAISGNIPATQLIQSGPFRFTRNPMYLAFTALHLSSAFWLENFWVLGTLLVALTVIAKIVVPREERFMTRKFGAQFVAYMNRTRRWI